MAVIALQSVRGGAGATSLTAAFAWALNQLGEQVITVDLSADNLLRMHFNMPVGQSRGWLRAAMDGQPWQQSALRYAPGLDFVPAGRLNDDERMDFIRHPEKYAHAWLTQIDALRKLYPWILLDVPSGDTPWTRAMVALADHILSVVTPDANCHIRLFQQNFPTNTLFLLNQFSPVSKAQQDLHQLWVNSLNNFIPLTLHRDEAVAEALMSKQPLGEYRPHSLAAEGMMTFASWALINLQARA